MESSRGNDELYTHTHTHKTEREGGGACEQCFCVGVSRRMHVVSVQTPQPVAGPRPGFYAERISSSELSSRQINKLFIRVVRAHSLTCSEYGNVVKWPTDV